MNRATFLGSLLAPSLVSLGLRMPRHGDVTSDGKGVWTSRQYYDTKLVHMRRWRVPEGKGRVIQQEGPPKILRKSAWNDVYLIDEQDVYAHIIQNLRFSDG